MVGRLPHVIHADCFLSACGAGYHTAWRMDVDCVPPLNQPFAHCAGASLNNKVRGLRLVLIGKKVVEQKDLGVIITKTVAKLVNRNVEQHILVENRNQFGANFIGEFSRSSNSFL